MTSIVFFATDATHGTELWITDGTAAGTYLLDDINSAIRLRVHFGHSSKVDATIVALHTPRG